MAGTDISAVKRPVCSMTVHTPETAPAFEHYGRLFHFCSAHSKDRFAADPESFLVDRPAPAPMPEGAFYTCPMHPEIEQVGPLDSHDETEAFRLAASLKRGSEHRLAEAIVRGAEERAVDMTKAVDFEAITGKGFTGKVDGKSVALGNAALIADLGLDNSNLADQANQRRDQGEMVMFGVHDRAIAGMVAVADPMKETTPAALKALHELGFRIIMATGDNQRRRWRRLTRASPSALGPTSRSKARGSRWSRATSAPSSAPGGCRSPPCATLART